MELGIFSKGPLGIREALGAVVGVFLQSLLYVSPELEKESKGGWSGTGAAPKTPASTQAIP